MLAVSKVRATPIGLYPAPDDTIHEKQFEIRQGRSITLHLVRLVTQLTDAANTHHSTNAFLLEVSKAFDNVWHEDLLYKLAYTPLSTMHLIGSPTEPSGGAWMRHALGSPCYRRRFSRKGRRPILYLVYTNDFPMYPRITLSPFAVDVTFHYSFLSPRNASTMMQR